MLIPISNIMKTTAFVLIATHWSVGHTANKNHRHALRHLLHKHIAATQPNIARAMRVVKVEQTLDNLHLDGAELHTHQGKLPVYGEPALEHILQTDSILSAELPQDRLIGTTDGTARCAMGVCARINNDTRSVVIEHNDTGPWISTETGEGTNQRPSTSVIVPFADAKTELGYKEDQETPKVARPGNPIFSTGIAFEHNQREVTVKRIPVDSADGLQTIIDDTWHVEAVAHNILHFLSESPEIPRDVETALRDSAEMLQRDLRRAERYMALGDSVSIDTSVEHTSTPGIRIDGLQDLANIDQLVEQFTQPFIDMADRATDSAAEKSQQYHQAGMHYHIIRGVLKTVQEIVEDYQLENDINLTETRFLSGLSMNEHFNHETNAIRCTKTRSGSPEIFG